MRITPSRLITRDLTANKITKRGSFRSKQDLPDKFTAFIDYFNTTLAKLFKWTYLVIMLDSHNHIASPTNKQDGCPFICCSKRANALNTSTQVIRLTRRRVKLTGYLLFVPTPNRFHGHIV